MYLNLIALFAFFVLWRCGAIFVSKILASTTEMADFFVTIFLSSFEKAIVNKSCKD